MTRRIALLVNPTSGKGRGARLLAPVSDQLRGAGVEVVVIVGRDADEAFDLVRTVVAGDPGVDGLVAVGGDGLVNIAVQVVAGTALPLGIIPAGTGNDVARALGIPRDDPRVAADLVLAGATRAVDLGRADGRWFAGVLGSGFDSMVNERANRMSWPTGRSRYNLAILAELRVFRPVPFMLEVDGEPWETEAMLVAVGNGSSYGGGMRVCPDARLDDGLLDVTVLGPISKPEFLRVFPSVYKGTHVHHRAVTVRRARTVVVSSPGVTAYADGERVAALPVRCDAVPAALNVFTGAGT
ncbi:MAG TPA: diacylglycerol kinase [Actinomycetes bacterium]|nr:diacylglycerol kinase [Actinomycetes bacterium]